MIKLTEAHKEVYTIIAKMTLESQSDTSVPWLKNSFLSYLKKLESNNKLYYTIKDASLDYFEKLVDDLFISGHFVEDYTARTYGNKMSFRVVVDPVELAAIRNKHE